MISYIFHILNHRALLLLETANRLKHFQLSIEFIQWMFEQEENLSDHFNRVDRWSRFPVIAIGLGSGSFFFILGVLFIYNGGQYPSTEAFVIPFLVMSSLAMRNGFLYLFRARMIDLHSLIQHLRVHEVVMKGEEKQKESERERDDENDNTSNGQHRTSKKLHLKRQLSSGSILNAPVLLFDRQLSGVGTNFRSPSPSPSSSSPPPPIENTVLGMATPVPSKLPRPVSYAVANHGDSGVRRVRRRSVETSHSHITLDLVGLHSQKTKKENTDGDWDNMNGLRMVYRRMLWTCFIYSLFWIALFTARLYVQFPRCLDIFDEEGNYVPIDTKCSLRVNIIRHAESSYIGNSLHYFYIAVLLPTMFAHEKVAILKKYVSIFGYCVGTAILLVKIVFDDPTDFIDISNFSCTWIALAFSSYKLSLWYKSKEIGVYAFLAFTLYVFIRFVNSFIVVDFYTKWDPSQRVLIVLVYHPLLSFSLTYAMSILQTRLADLLPETDKEHTSKLFAFQVGAQLLFRPLGRMYLFNIDDLYAQVASAVILSTVDSSFQLMRPTRVYYLHRLLGKNPERALEEREKVIHNETWRHDEYTRMAVELFSIVACAVLSIIIRQYYEIPHSIVIIIASMCIQLTAEIFISDLWSSFLETYFYKLSTKVWYDHQKSGSYRYISLLSLLLVAGLTWDFIRVATSGAD